MSLRGGVDLGGTKIQAIVVDANNTVLGASRAPTPTTGGPLSVAAAITRSFHQALAKAEVSPSDLLGVGVGSPGEVDESRGVVGRARNLPKWDEPFPLGMSLSDSIGAPVRLGNDVAVATNAEFVLGAGRPYRSLLGVFWGTGVGGGLILDGQLWTGRGGAGEIGHVVVKQDGARCPCGRKGCLEAYAGRAAMEARARRLVKRGGQTNLFKLMKEHDAARLTSGIWARALDRQDKLAHQLIQRAVLAMGAGIASAINLVDVDAVVIGGGLGDRLGQPYADAIAAAMAPHLFADQHPPDVCVTTLGDFGGALGAAMLISGRPRARRS